MAHDEAIPNTAAAPQRRSRLSPPAFSAVVAGLLGFLLFGSLYAASPILHDTDSSYHLHMARRYASGDWSDHLDNTRRSLFAEHFGDKELLFHVLLLPFSRTADPMLGGRLFLACLDALVLATLGALAARWLGRWGWCLPLGLVLTAMEFDWRLVRLRPELLSLTLLLLAAAAVAARRYRLLGFLALAYALSYIAWHAFLGLCGLWFLLFGLLRKEWDPLALAYPAAGVCVGLLVHPQFPANLAVAWAVHVDFFRLKSTLDVGSEILPNTTEVVLFANLGFWMGLFLLWRSREPKEAGSSPTGSGLEADSAERASLAYGAGAVLFGLLYLLMSRFSLYFLPLSALTLLAAMAARGQQVGSRVYWFRQRSVPLAAALGVVLLISLPSLARESASYRHKTAPGPNNERISDREAFGRAVPPAAKVAAPWGSTSLYLLYAPQGRYLNVLDPVLMAAGDPESYTAQKGIFDGTTPDIPLALRRELDSDYLAFAKAGAAPRLLSRLDRDPRLVERYRRFQVLYQVQLDANRDFWLDWQRVPPAQPTPGKEFSVPDEWPRYPRLSPANGGDVEGFVDLARTGSHDCERLVRPWHLDSPRFLALEFAPFGPGAITLDGVQLVATRAELGAVLGQGLLVSRALAPGPHVLVVEICPDHARTWHGFYLRNLTPSH